MKLVLKDHEGDIWKSNKGSDQFLVNERTGAELDICIFCIGECVGCKFNYDGGENHFIPYKDITRIYPQKYRI